MQYSHSDIYAGTTGVLLAGGASKRMGFDKAFILMAGEALYTRALDLLCRYFNEVIIAGDRPDLACPEIPVIPDIYPGSALGGLFTGLSAAETDWVFVAPCDMPYPDPRILEQLLALRERVDAVVPRTPAGFEPVFALYHKNCLLHMEAMLRSNQFRIFDFYQKINVQYLDWHEMPGDWQRSLLNINTPEQLEQLRRKPS